MKNKKYWYSVVEEMIMNLDPKYDGLRGGRVEIYEEPSETGYAIDEARFLIPEEMMEKFRDLFSGLETDKLPYINFGGEYGDK